MASSRIAEPGAARLATAVPPSPNAPAAVPAGMFGGVAAVAPPTANSAKGPPPTRSTADSRPPTSATAWADPSVATPNPVAVGAERLAGAAVAPTLADSPPSHEAELYDAAVLLSRSPFAFSRGARGESLGHAAQQQQWAQTLDYWLHAAGGPLPRAQPSPSGRSVGSPEWCSAANAPSSPHSGRKGAGALRHQRIDSIAESAALMLRTPTLSRAPLALPLALAPTPRDVPEFGPAAPLPTSGIPCAPGGAALPCACGATRRRSWS